MFKVESKVKTGKSDGELTKTLEFALQNSIKWLIGHEVKSIG